MQDAKRNVPDSHNEGSNEGNEGTTFSRLRVRNLPVLPRGIDIVFAAYKPP